MSVKFEIKLYYTVYFSNDGELKSASVLITAESWLSIIAGVLVTFTSTWTCLNS